MAMMTAINDVTRELRERHSHIVQDTTFRLYGLQWDLSPGVYAPNLTQGAALYVDWIRFPRGKAFCEIGCGTGYLSVMAARAGCNRVVASDIASAAVANTRRNVERHGVVQQVDVRQSDLFNAMGKDEKFDIIFWNSSFVDADKQHDLSDLDTALVDPGYQTHERFLREAPAYLTESGRLLIGFTDLGNLARLSELAEKLDLTLNVARAAYVETQYRGITYQLLELKAA